MGHSIIQGLIDNVAILLALGLIYDVVAYKSWLENKAVKSLSGVVLGIIGIVIMINPWQYEPGLFFDTRSIVLSVGGLFFGTVPALIAIIMTGALRIYQGGIGMYAGLGVIVTSGLFGVLLRQYKLRGESVRTVVGLHTWELYGLGIVVHVAMLLWMLVLPKPDTNAVIAKIALPVMLLYPLGTVLLGMFIISRVRQVALDRGIKISEERYRSFVENASDAFFVTDIQGRILDVNTTTCLALGYSRKELLKLYISDIDANHIPQKMHKTRKQIINGSLKTIRTDHKRKDGGIFPVEVRVRSYGTKEKPLFLSLARDISDRQKADAELERTVSLLEAIFAAMPDALLAVNLDRVIISVNKASTRIFGFSEEDMIGKPSHLLYETRAEYERQGSLRHNMSAKERMEPYIAQYRKKDGTVFPGETLGVPIFNRAHEKIGYIGIIRDISDRLQMEMTLRQSQKLEAVGTMVGGISHELNNILQSIFLYGGLIQDDLPAGSDLEENINQLLADGERARDLVTQILTFSRKTKVNYKVQPIHEIVSSALNFERASLPPNIEFVLDIQGNGEMVLCDQTQIHQVVINLCNNAIHAMGESGGKLTVSLHRKMASIGLDSSEINVLELKVTDTGHGMSSHIIDRIFDPFFTTKSMGEGTGLGLSVIHGIIEMMDGQISVESKLDQGSSFQILLPIAEGVQAEIPQEIQAASPQKYEKVLLVDDELSIRQVTQTALKRKGFSVDVAGDGKQALELFKGNESKYDLIITDLSMPNMSGVELSQEIRETDPTVPILLSTGHLGLNDRVQFSKAGISGFIQKPWSIEELMERVRELNSQEGETDEI